MLIDLMKKSELKMIFGALLTLVLGIVLAVAPQTSLQLLTSVIGIVLMILGLLSIINFIRLPKEEKMVSGSLVLGFLVAMIGLFLFINNKALVNFITTIIGLTLAVKGLYKIQFAITLKNTSDEWKWNLLLGILILTVSVLLIINPFDGASVFMTVVGILLIIGSVIEIVESIRIVKNLDKVKELPYSEKSKKEEVQ